MGIESNLLTLIKLFVIPLIAGVIFGLVSMGPGNFSSNIISASLVVGFEFLVAVWVFNHFMPTARRTHQAVLFAAVGAGSGITWWSVVQPPWSPFIAIGIGGLLAGLWAHLQDGYA